MPAHCFNPNLLLHDPERLLRLLNNPQRPVQLIMAGKAHPANQVGQFWIQDTSATARARRPCITANRWTPA
jgi:glucan phosphorylase